MSAAEQVFYVAYGSNLDRRRFHVYLEGGRPPGAARTYSGARDRRLPELEVPVTLPHRLYLAGTSRVWGGSMAFIDPTCDPDAVTLAVGYLVTAEQFADVVAQERGGDAPGPDGLVVPAGAALRLAGGSHYDLVVGLDPIDGVPAVTFTSGDPVTPRGRAAAAYAATIVAGLAQHHGLDTAEARAYLERRGG